MDLEEDFAERGLGALEEIRAAFCSAVREGLRLRVTFVEAARDEARRQKEIARRRLSLNFPLIMI